MFSAFAIIDCLRLRKICGDEGGSLWHCIAVCELWWIEWINEQRISFKIVVLEGILFSCFGAGLRLARRFIACIRLTRQLYRYWSALNHLENKGVAGILMPRQFCEDNTYLRYILC